MKRNKRHDNKHEREKKTKEANITDNKQQKIIKKMKRNKSHEDR